MPDDLASPDSNEIRAEFVPVEDAAQILNMTVRSATRYAPKVRTIRSGQRILYHRGDLMTLAEKMHAGARPRKNEIQRREITDLLRSVGNLEGQIAAQQRQIDIVTNEREQAREQTQEARIKQALAEAERDRLQSELERTRAALASAGGAVGLPPAPALPEEHPARSWFRKILRRD